MVQRLLIIFWDIKSIFHDLSVIFYFFNKNLFNTKNYKIKLSMYFNQFNDRRKYILKKYVYTINHKRIAINYFYFSMWTGISGGILATMIRLELAHPGS